MNNNLGNLLGSCQTDSIPLLASWAMVFGLLRHRYARYYVSCLDLYEQGICLRSRRANGNDNFYRWADIRRVWLERIPNGDSGESMRIDIIAPNLDVIFSVTIANANSTKGQMMQQLFDRWHQATWRHYHVVSAVITLSTLNPPLSTPNDSPTFLCMQKPDTRYSYTSRHWEFPGGKVENGETEPEAIKRELREEMEYEVTVLEHLTSVEHNYPDFGITLSCWLCQAETNQFTRKEHIDHRWLTLDEMQSLDWCEADRPVLEVLKTFIVKRKSTT